MLFLSNSCATLTNAIAAFSVLQYIPWAAFACLRTYALCEHHCWTVATVVFLLSSVPIGTNFSRYRWLGSTTIPVLSCLPEAAIPEELVVTWRATYYGSKAQASGVTRRPSFSNVLLQDGTIYFLYVTIFTEPITAILISRFILDLQEVQPRSRSIALRPGDCTSEFCQLCQDHWSSRLVSGFVTRWHRDNHW
ncbi:hypothetical protein K466DRAFT_392183 [Polyporus arcularius HHB13444]|uniref:Uncharacterized protein n=1 Tax=Polyporus arcularius HHB13444 TaxID=1314778 RepID=A0A5C3NS65_9APHY|nr:hypothetical protein K466DRAFT_392183 [Polyporus arcularius HHB13444]